MKDELHFRRYLKTDDQDLSKLMAEIFGEDLNDKFFAWKYRQNPAGEALSAIAEMDGEVIGQVGAIPIRFSVKGEECIGSQEVDGCLDKKKGKFDTIFHLIRLRQKINEEENIDFSYFFSVAISSKIALRSERNKKVCSTPILAKVVDSEPFIRKILPVKGLSRLLAIPVNLFLRLWYSSKRTPPKGTRIKEIEQFDERFDTFWARIKEDYPIMTTRDSTYLNWRYVAVPDREYTILSLEAEETAEILAYIVLSEKQKEYKIGQILDIITPRHGHEQITRFLLGQANLYFRKKKIALAGCWMLPHSHIFSELIRVGFRTREKSGIDFIFRSTYVEKPTIPLDFVLEKENWYICRGDADYY